VLGLVGESGCGKTVTSLSILRLVPSPPGRVTAGAIRFAGRDLLGLAFRELRHVRGGEIAMVFQDPMASLNPAFTVGNQLIEAQRLHRAVSRVAARARAEELLARVGIPDPGRRLDEHPHQFSGGMRQRVMIAMALANEPRLLIADEPTTALDVTTQAEVLDLLRSLQRELGMAVLFVTHDLGVVADFCDRLAVMYAGQIVETGRVDDVFAAPRHPYTEGLLASVPEPGVDRRLVAIPGTVPNPGAFPIGCRFHPRCRYAEDRCATDPVALTAGARCVRCHELVLEGAR
jgi:oligopeptide/dipeptide ABC transporter ATP-binding protein